MNYLFLTPRIEDGMKHAMVGSNSSEIKQGNFQVVLGESVDAKTVLATAAAV